MPTSTVEVLTEEQARERRAALLASVGGDEETLRDRAESYALTAHEMAVLEQIEDLDFLLQQ